MRFLLTSIPALVFVASAFGQSTTVSGTIVDGGGQAWFAGTYSFVFQPNPTNPGAIYTWTGGPFTKTITGQLNGSGAYSAITMPSSGCPCRVSISWYQFVTLSGSSGVFEALVSDGTNVMAESEWGISLNNGPSGGGDGWSPVTYANSANVTFTLKVQADTGSVTARAAPFHAYGARNSRLEISVLSSN